MLRCVLSDISGIDIAAPPALTLNIDVDEGVPADSLYAVFPYFEAAELMRVRVFSGNDIVFAGVVDEEERINRPSGRTLRISARSLAAHLLDNEAAPCSYDHPSARLICERYALPYGITVGDCDDSVYLGEQSVMKGSSCWNVLKNFCSACYSSIPRINGEGVLYLKGMKKDDKVCFGGSKGIRYIEMSEKYKRCEEISAVHIKTLSLGGYRLPIENTDAVGRGIVRERFLNAVMTESPMKRAESMIRSGAEKAYTVKVRCPSELLGIEGCEASIERGDEKIKDLYISALRYRMSRSGEYTDVIMKRRMN